MTHRVKTWSRPIRRAVAIGVVATLTPLPLMAAESGSAPKPGAIRASITKIPVKDAPGGATTRRSGTRSAAQPSQGQDRSFFKTGPGILALAVMIAGTGYAIYSTQNDRIKSPGKE